MGFREQLAVLDGQGLIAPAVTLPVYHFKEADSEEIVREKEARRIETRTVKAGIEAWQAIGRADSFEAWKLIGAALSVGKQYALRVTGANAAWGRNYSRLCDVDAGKPGHALK